MLMQRVLTAMVIVAAVLVAIFWLPKSVVFAILGLLLLIAAWEWSGFIGSKKMRTRIGYPLIVAALMLLLWWGLADDSSLSLLLWLTLAWWLVALIWVTSFPSKVNSAATVVSGFLVLIPAWASLGSLYLIRPDGPELLLVMLVIVWAADIGAFLSGKLFGRVKLAPQVSPNKTWEGAVGGIASATVAAYGGAFWLDAPVVAFVPLGIGVASVSIVGDLTVSMFKRHAGLKDSGKIFPGHGGLLDRMDSVAAAAPLFLLGIGWLGMLA